jgi:tryptophan synthase alpha chain
MQLESYIRNRLKDKDILLMTHIVLGYPSFKHCYEIVKTMAEAGTDLIELQVPFSEPIADGPVILRANQMALKGGTRIQSCLDFAQEVTKAFHIPFLMMTYYNIVFRYGVKRFVSAMARIGIHGIIIPDLPPEEGHDYLETIQASRLSPIYIFSPTTSDSRMKYIATHAGGFIYCVARTGVTGAHTDFSDKLSTYLARCRKASHLPLAVGFGVKDKADIDFLRGKADIAVIGTQAIRIMEENGLQSVGDFVRNLR